MKTILMLTMSMLLLGCTMDMNSGSSIESNSEHYALYDEIIDDCHYVIVQDKFGSSEGISLVHKANCDNPVHNQSEYSLEILDQNTVKVTSNSTGNAYIVPFDKVEEALIKDNL